VDKNLTNEIIGGPVSGNRRRTGSWLESISNKPINTGHQRVRSPSPHHNRKPSSEVGNLIQIETQGRPTAASMDPILSTSMTDWWGQLKKGLEDEEPVPVKDKTMENKPVADNIKPEKLEKPPPSTTMDSVKMETPRSHSRNNSRSTSKSRVLRFDNGVYRGDTILSSDGNLLAHGVGCFTASNGEIYLGQWVNGKRTGKGYKTWQDGKEYIGSWVANRRSGHGVITWPSGDVYSGELSYGFQQGKGMLKSSNGDTYIGEWTVNEKQGYGVLYYATGDVFSGEWKHNKKDGPGIYKFAAGQTKIGEWKDNIFIPSEEKKEKKKNQEDIQYYQLEKGVQKIQLETYPNLPVHYQRRILKKRKKGKGPHHLQKKNHPPPKLKKQKIQKKDLKAFETGIPPLYLQSL